MTLKKRERQESILEQFRVTPSVRLASLADRFAVTKETIRRDIDELAARGLLARTYGGAVASPMNAEPGLSERELLVNPDGRRRMAKAAVDLLAGCAILMIDAGSTAAHVCEALTAVVPRAGRGRLTVITNSLRNASILGANPAIRVMIAPGDYDPRENAAFGRHTLDFLARFRADAAVTSAGGIAEGYAADANSEAVAVKRGMIAQAIEQPPDRRAGQVRRAAVRADRRAGRLHPSRHRRRSAGHRGRPANAHPSHRKLTARRCRQHGTFTNSGCCSYNTIGGADRGRPGLRVR